MSKKIPLWLPRNLFSKSTKQCDCSTEWDLARPINRGMGNQASHLLFTTKYTKYTKRLPSTTDHRPPVPDSPRNSVPSVNSCSKTPCFNSPISAFSFQDFSIFP